MNFVDLEIELKATYVRHDGKNEEIPFKLKKALLTDGICEECKKKKKTEKNTILKSVYFSLNELCQKCQDSIYFHQSVSKKRNQYVVTI